MKVSLFSGCPRELGRQKQWIDDEIEKWRIINDMNGHEDCFLSIYRFLDRKNEKNYGDADDESAIIDKVYFDFDVKWGYELKCKFHEFLLQKKILHRVNFSGKHSDKRAIGFHFYAFVNREPVHKKNAIAGFQRKIDRWLVQWLREKYGRKEVDEELKNEYKTYQPHVVDPTIVGDLVRISRVPNTWNPTSKWKVEIRDDNHEPTGEYKEMVKKRDIFCIPLTHDTVDLQPEEIYALAQKPFIGHDGNVYFGEDLLDLTHWDVPRVNLRDDLSIAGHLIKPNTEILETTPLPYCIRCLMNEPHLDWERRFWLIVLLRDWGLTPEEVAIALESFLDPNWFAHCVEPRNYLNIREDKESGEITRTSNFNPNLKAGEDMIFRVFYGNQKNSFLKGGCRFMRLISKCAKETVFGCDLRNPVYLL